LLNKRSTMVELYKSGDLDACVDLAKQMLESNPDSIAPLQYAARIHTRRREHEFAKPFWNKLTVLAPELLEPFLQSARIARLKNDWDICERYINEFVLQKPDHPEALDIQVQCFIHNRNFEKIGRTFASLYLINPQAIPPNALLAAESGMGIELAKSLSRAAIKDQTAKELCVELADAARDAAVGFEIQKNTMSASNCYQTMRIYTPDSSYPTTSLNRLCRPFLQKAQVAYREKNYAKAIKQAQICMEISPLESGPYIIAGRSSALLDKHQDAFDILGAKIESLWDNSWLVLNYARAAMRLQKPAIAYIAFSAVKSRDDEKSSTYHAECEKQLDRMSEMATQEVQVLLANNNILRAFDKIFEYKNSGLSPKNSAGLVARILDLGQSKLKELCNYEGFEALDYARNLVRLDPGAKYAYRIAGHLLLKDQMYAESHYYWSQLARLDDKNPDPILNLTRCYINLNNISEAMKAVSALLELDPDHEEGKRISVSLAERKI